MTWTTTDSPVGDLLMVADGHALTAIRFSPFVVPPEEEDPDDPALAAAAAQLREYFAGSRTSFTLPLAPSGTSFQLRVWGELVHVGYGTTASYGEIAHRLGLPPGASRAVGLANGSNPLPIVVPCHRVIGSNGKLTGYAGGLERKRFLLELENPALV